MVKRTDILPTANIYNNRQREYLTDVSCKYSPLLTLPSQAALLDEQTTEAVRAINRSAFRFMRSEYYLGMYVSSCGVDPMPRGRLAKSERSPKD